MASKRFVRLTREGKICGVAVDRIIMFVQDGASSGTGLILDEGHGVDVVIVDEPIEKVGRLLQEAE